MAIRSRWKATDAPRPSPEKPWLEVDSAGYLHVARCAYCSGRDAEERIGWRNVWQIEGVSVESIQELDFQLKRDMLSDGRLLDHAYILVEIGV